MSVTLGKPPFCLGVFLLYCSVGDMLNPQFLVLKPQGRHLPVPHLPATRIQAGSRQSEWMLLTGTLSLEPGAEAKGTVKINFWQHAGVAAVSQHPGQAVPEVHSLRSLGLCSVLSPFLLPPVDPVSTRFPSNKSHQRWCQHQISFQ